jgi:hypothetical protein
MGLRLALADLSGERMKIPSVKTLGHFFLSSLAGLGIGYSWL